MNGCLADIVLAKVEWGQLTLFMIVNLSLVNNLSLFLGQNGSIAETSWQIIRVKFGVSIVDYFGSTRALIYISASSICLSYELFKQVWLKEYFSVTLRVSLLLGRSFLSSDKHRVCSFICCLLWWIAFCATLRQEVSAIATANSKVILFATSDIFILPFFSTILFSSRF